MNFFSLTMRRNFVPGNADSKDVCPFRKQMSSDSMLERFELMVFFHLLDFV